MQQQDLKSVVQAMSIEAKVGQLWMANICGDETVESIRDQLRMFRFGGVMLSLNYRQFVRARSSIACGVSRVHHPSVVARRVHEIQRAAREEVGFPLFVGGDQEGGAARSLLRRHPFTIVPTQMGLAASREAERDTALAARIVGKEMHAVGFNMVYGPILDLHLNPANPEVGTRAFSANPDQTAKLGAIYAREVARAGIIPCVKHFPGRGRGSSDAHFELEVIDTPREILEQEDIRAFARIENSAAVMIGHTVYSALDPDYPASLSPRVVTDVLRRQIGFSGVIITDELTMWAVAHNFSVPEACVLALEAGVDMFFLKAPEHFPAAKEAVLNAVHQGRLSEEQIDRSVLRVLSLKNRFGLLRDQTVVQQDTGGTTERTATAVGSAAHRRNALRLARNSLTCLRGQDMLRFPRGTRILSVVTRDLATIQTNDGVLTHQTLGNALAKRFERTETIVVDEEVVDLQIFHALVLSQEVDVVVLLVASRRWTSTMQKITEGLVSEKQPQAHPTAHRPELIVLIAETPWMETMVDPAVGTVYCCYCQGPFQYRAFAERISRDPGTTRSGAGD